jgi:hypothetical protein
MELPGTQAEISRISGADFAHVAEDGSTKSYSDDELLDAYSQARRSASVPLSSI